MLCGLCRWHRFSGACYSSLGEKLAKPKNACSILAILKFNCATSILIRWKSLLLFVFSIGICECVSGNLVCLNSLDFVQLGDKVSEAKHNIVAPNTRITTGGLGEQCRQIEPEGEIAFTLRCDPKAQNYLTVKLWGSDTQSCLLFLADESGKRYGSYLSEMPELSYNRSEAEFPGRFVYVTIPIPKELTEGKTQVRLKLIAIGSVAPYAPPDIRERPLKSPSRGIYRIYIHKDPFFEPEPDEKQGKPQLPKLKQCKPISELIALNRKQIDEAVERLLQSQIYGSRWKERIERGEIPSISWGATTRANPPTNLTKQAFLDWLTQRTTDGNCADLGIVGIYARAYNWGGSKFHGSQELIDRIVAALDYFARAQGANGGFTARQWVGVAKRNRGWSCLEGYGTRWLARAFLEVADVLKAKGILEEAIDDDGDPATPPILRGKVYARMFASHRDYLVREARGHATNQDLVQIQSMWLCNEALRHLSPEEAWSRDAALKFVYSAVGLSSDPLGGFWFSPKGLPLEPWGTLGGGYCGNYGIECAHLTCEMAELTGDEKVKRQALKAIEAISHFFYPDTTADGFRCWRREEVISTRNNFSPGRIDYPINFYAAAVLKSPIALRALQIWLEDGNEPFPLDWRNAHFVSMVLKRIYSAQYFEQLLTEQMPPTNVRLFMEHAQPDMAWVDELGHVVAVRHSDGSRLYVSLQWRRGFKAGGRSPKHVRVNNLARIHHTTQIFDRIATIFMEAPNGFGKLYILRYGPYFIAVNLTDDTTYTVNVPFVSEAIDIVTGKQVYSQKHIHLLPRRSIVLYCKTL
ncbi:MAG: hypothetical protein NZ781_08535 [Armatimonadetes bacterium]|nr:hypothetical protein [Armatimonadota bacterium]